MQVIVLSIDGWTMKERIGIAADLFFQQSLCPECQMILVDLAAIP